MSATLAGKPISRATVQIPRVGVWSAEVDITVPADLVGAVTLVIGDLILAGSIVRGGPVEGSASYLVTGGAGGWRKIIATKPLRNDLGVKLSTVLKDAASAAGETIQLAADRVIGVAWPRREGPAWDVLGRLVSSWWVDAAGVTQVGPRPAPALSVPYRLVAWDRGAGMRTIATETPAAFAPGALLDGSPIEEVVIDVDHNETRLRVRTSEATSTLRGLVARLVRRELARAGLLIAAEYRVVQQDDAYVDLQIVRRSTGLPDAARMRARPGAAGYSVTYTLGSTVLVGFAEGDPAKGFIAFGGEVGASGTVPQSVSLAAVNEANLDATAVTVGGAVGRQAVARAPAVVTWAASVTTAIGQIATYVNALAPGTVTPAPPLSSSVTSGKLSSQ